MEHSVCQPTISGCSHPEKRRVRPAGQRQICGVAYPRLVEAGWGGCVSNQGRNAVCAGVGGVQGIGLGGYHSIACGK
jgi:hypothetical protein